MWDYTDKVKDHFLNPRNVGEISDATVVAEVGNITCGDALKLYLKLDENNIIKDVKFKTFGCGSAIASSSALTELIMGKSIDEAEKITNKEIADYLGGLPEEKMHCSVMGKEALEKAISQIKGIEYTEHNEGEEGKIICKCFGVTDEKIKKVAKENNLRSVPQVTYYCKAGGGCTSCHAQIEDILKELWGEKPKVKIETQKITKSSLFNIQKMQLVIDTIEKEIRPILEKDSGDIELVDIQGNNVIVSLRGNCAGCAMSELTVKHFVEAKLREFVSDDIIVTEQQK